MKRFFVGLLFGFALAWVAAELWFYQSNRELERARRRLEEHGQESVGRTPGSFLEQKQRSAAERDDGRARIDRVQRAVDEGILFTHGQAPEHVDLLGARDVTIFEEAGTVYLGYDGAGPAGWRACLASSKDLLTWQRHGVILPLGLSGARDRCYAGYPVLGKHDGDYFCYYVGAAAVTGLPWRVPALPYTSHAARATAVRGPWAAAPELARGLELGAKGSFDEATLTPGPIFRYQDRHWMICSAAGGTPLKRTLVLAAAPSPLGPWTKNATPLLPPDEQIENAAVYYEPANKTWFLFTNHVALRSGHEFTNAIWMYWSADPLRWEPSQKAVVVDGTALGTEGTPTIVGLPAVLPRDGRLLLFFDRLPRLSYDPAAADVAEHCHRDIAAASLPLPLAIPDDMQHLDPARFLLDGLVTEPAQLTPRGTVVINDQTRRRVFMLHPGAGTFPARYHASGHVPASGLSPQRFSIAIHPEAALKTDGVEFRVLVFDAANEAHELFSRELRPREQPADRGWMDATLDFGPFAGQRIRVILETRCGPAGDNQNDWALWSFAALPLR